MKLHKKRILSGLLSAALSLSLLTACGSSETAGAKSTDTLLLATTQPMYELTQRIVGDTPGFQVEAMITEQVSCLHDYTITTQQMKKIEEADAVILSGAGLEDFMSSALSGKSEEEKIDSSKGIELLDGDPHIWLDPRRYAHQGENIAEALGDMYPDYADTFLKNAQDYETELLGAYQNDWYPAAQELSCKNLITFHDGFTYFADAYGLTILAAIEEEEGSEPSASELKEIAELVEQNSIPTIFTEKNGATNAAEVISQETGAAIGVLDLGMSSDSGGYEAAMNSNLSALKAGLQ